MNDTTTHGMLKELRILRLHAVLSTLVIITLAVAAFRSQRSQTVDVLDVKRINVLNDSGTPALVIAGVGRLAGPTFDGKEYPQELSGGRTGASGMIFFNERGDEVGGLTYAGRLVGDGYQAGGGIMFDQFRQDQVVGMQYQDDGTARSAGFHVWDRNPDIHIGDLIEILQARRTATGAARDSVEQALREATAGGLGAHRVFLGSENRNAMLGLQDPDGRIRVRLSVDSLGVARLEFLDETGKVTREVSE
jgi:hypothetical protein